MAKQAFAATAFKSEEGQIFFAPFGVYGRSYPIRTNAEFEALWKGVSRFAFPAATIILTILAIWLGRSIFPAPIQWVLALAATAGFVVWMITFVAWARIAAARLSADCISDAGAPGAATAQSTEAPPRRSFSAIQPDVATLRRTGKEVLAQVLDTMRDRYDVRVETLMVALGSLAGFAAQIGLREAARIADAEAPLMAIATKSGRTFFFGDALNALLAENPNSVFSIVSEAPLQQGLTIPDMPDIFQHVAASVGSDAFGIPRVELSQPAATPTEFVRSLWPETERLLWKACPPYGWAAAIAYAARYAACSFKTTPDLGTAVSLIMESAIPMSKLDPQEVGGTRS